MLVRKSLLIPLVMIYSPKGWSFSVHYIGDTDELKTTKLVNYPVLNLFFLYSLFGIKFAAFGIILDVGIQFKHFRR